MRRDIATIMPLPVRSSRRASQWVTMSWARVATRWSDPTIASTRAHRDFKRSTTSSSEPSVASTNSVSMIRCASSGSSTFARRAS